jgi:hypothetical protein
VNSRSQRTDEPTNIWSAAVLDDTTALALIDPVTPVCFNLFRLAPLSSYSVLRHVSY